MWLRWFCEAALLHGEERILSQELCVILISVYILSLYWGASVCRPLLNADVTKRRIIRGVFLWYSLQYSKCEGYLT